ncbi:hypothetical protein ACWD8L_40245 [Streptomyces sp. NPDC005133]
MDNLEEWRIRAIERIELSSALWSTREREIHVRPLTQAFPDLQLEPGAVEIVLPITELPKIPLLDLNITVAGEHVYRVPLDDSAHIQAAYIKRLAERAELDFMQDGKRFPDDLVLFLASIFFFPSAEYREIHRKYNRLSWRLRSWHRSDNTAEPMFELLRDAEFPLGGNAQEERAAFRRWYATATEIKRVVLKETVEDFMSGAEYPLIAIPHLDRELQLSPDNRRLDALRCETMLTDLARLLSKSEEISGRGNEGQSQAAAKLLCAYAAYGRRWMAFAKCEVPTNKPFIITVKEQRSIYFDRKRKRHEAYNPARAMPFGQHLGKTAWKEVSFRDAETSHVSIRTSDSAVRLHHCEAMKERCAKIERSNADEESKTSELYLRHDSSPDRPERMWIRCHLRLPRLTSMFLYLAMIIIAFGIGLLAWRGLDVRQVDESEPNKSSDYLHGLTAKDAAVILIPATIVAAFLLVKEQSTLVLRLRRFRQSILQMELFILLALPFILYVIRRVWST